MTIHSDLLDHMIKDEPTHTVTLPAVDTSRFDQQCREDWSNGFFRVHIQDKSLSALQRKFLACLGNLKWGRRWL